MCPGKPDKIFAAQVGLELTVAIHVAILPPIPVCYHPHISCASALSVTSVTTLDTLSLALHPGPQVC